MTQKHIRAVSSSDLEKLRAVDLNLLVVLGVVLEEGNASTAGRRLGLSQSGVSRALARLRDAFDDPLVTRAPRGLVPTRRAQELREPIASLLSDARELFAPKEFNARELSRRFRVAGEDLFETILLPSLLQHLFDVAPNVSLHVLPFGPTSDSAVERGEADLTLHPSAPTGAGWKTQALFWDDTVCIVNRGHPVDDEEFDLDHFCTLRHVVLDRGGGRPTAIDNRLAERGRTRCVVARVQSFGCMPTLVATSDRLIATVPRSLGTLWSEQWGLELREPEFVRTRFPLRQNWYVSDDSDPAHRWFRQQLAEVARGRGLD